MLAGQEDGSGGDAKRTGHQVILNHAAPDAIVA
jgi:hypothetical protein